MIITYYSSIGILKESQANCTLNLIESELKYKYLCLCQVREELSTN